MAKQDNLMSARPDQPDCEADLAEALSPFRAAFAKAREEGVGVTELQPPALKPRGGGGQHPQSTREPDFVRFEVRIEKRRGKGDAARWNELGNNGWELIAVTGKKAFFKRRRCEPKKLTS